MLYTSAEKRVNMRRVTEIFLGLVFVLCALAVSATQLSGCSGDDDDDTTTPGTGGSTSSNNQELQAAADDVAAGTVDLIYMTQSLTTISTDSEFGESVADKGVTYTGPDCAILDGLSVGQCPTYTIACSNDEITGLTLNFGSTCTDGKCKKAGREISGAVTISRVKTGTFTITFNGYTSGDIELAGSVTVAISHDNASVTHSITTGTDPLTITLNKGTASERITNVTLTTLQMVHYAQETNGEIWRHIPGEGAKRVLDRIGLPSWTQ